MSIITSLPVRRAAVSMAMTRYSQLPDAEDRIGDSLLALVEAEHNFEPQPGRDTDGYRARYSLGQVAGRLRRAAELARAASDAEITASDLGNPELFYDGYSDLLEAGRLWVVDGAIVPEREIIAAHDNPALARDLLDMLAADTDECFAPAPEAWYAAVPEKAPLFYSDIPNPELVLAASVGQPPWADGQPVSVYEGDRLDAASAARPVNELARDRSVWADEILEAWGDARAAWGYICDPSPILGYLASDTDAPGDPGACLVIAMMEKLQDLVAEHTDEDNYDLVGRAVARSLAERVTTDGMMHQPAEGSLQDVLREAFVDFLGVEPDWFESVSLPSKQVLRRHAKGWLANLRCWPSQRVGIQVLLAGGSPYDARLAEDAWFENRQRRS